MSLYPSFPPLQNLGLIPHHNPCLPQVATVVSAVKLEQEQQLIIAKKLQELTGSKNIKLKPEYDESLIAGFVVEYGSSQIDLSVRGAIDRVKSQLAAVEV